MIIFLFLNVLSKLQRNEETLQFCRPHQAPRKSQPIRLQHLHHYTSRILLKYNSYLHSAVFTVRTERTSIQAIRYAVTCHPLVGILSTLRHHTGNSCFLTQFNLYPLSLVVLPSRPCSSVASIRHTVEPRPIGTMVPIPLTGGCKRPVSNLTIF